MKKIILSVLIVALLVSCVAFTVFGDTFDVSTVEVKTADAPTIKADKRFELSLNFYIKKDTVTYLEENASDVSIFAVTVDYTENMAAPDATSGSETDLMYIEDVIISGTKYAVYSYNFGILDVSEYLKTVAIRAFLSFKLKGSVHTVSSDFTTSKNVISPYDAVYNAYCDRPYAIDANHPYAVGDGTFSAYQDLDPLRKILATYLYVDIRVGKAKDKKENRYYDSFYDLDYFDGVLTITMKNSDIPSWMLYKLYVNGEERYFEIYEGKIKLVV